MAFDWWIGVVDLPSLRSYMDGQWESDDVERLVYELLRIEDLTKELRIILIIFIALRDCNMGGGHVAVTHFIFLNLTNLLD